MKSYNHLFEKVVDVENIKTAMRNAAKKKKKGRKRKEDIQYIMENMDSEAEKLSKMLIEGTYKIPDHTLYKITDGSKHKERYIIKPFYMYEQIVHHAIIQVLKPIFMKGMYEYCVGSVPGRGDIKAKKYIEKFIREHPDKCKYWFKIDIRHFFQSINHRILKEKLQNIIHDKRMMLLLEQHIDAYVDHEMNGEKYGLPLGYYTSQWFANFYMQDLDHYIKEVLNADCYSRYMDDMPMCSNNKKKLHRDKVLIAAYANVNLDLRIKDDWQIFRFDYIDKKTGERKGRPLDYMGYQFYRDRTILRKYNMIKTTRKANKLEKKDKITWYDAAQMISYMGKFKHTDTYHCYENYIKDKVNIKKLKKKISNHDRRLNENERESEMETRTVYQSA